MAANRPMTVGLLKALIHERPNDMPVYVNDEPLMAVEIVDTEYGPSVMLWGKSRSER